jgi:molecular chaperone GrpE
MNSEDRQQRDGIAADATSDSASDINDSGSLETPEIQEGEGLEDSAGAKVIDARELDALQERYLRLAAEYENFRKRTERERAELWDRAQGHLVGKLLEIVDDLDRITRFTPEGTNAEAVLEGVRLIDRKLVRTLEAAGLEPVPVEGEKFDPQHHEALMMTPTADAAEDDTIGNVFQAGYSFKGTLLRPARVQVKRLE